MKKKAFDAVKHTNPINLLHEREVNLVGHFYWEQTEAIKMGDKITNSVSIRRSVRQRCIFSPYPFNTYSEKIFQNAVSMNNIGYADGAVILINS